MSETTIVAEPKRHDVVITRTFDAPRDLVFKAMTDPDLIPRWWGPPYLTTTVDKMDVRPGGIWRYVHTDPDGGQQAFNGVYHVISPPEKLVYTFEWEGLPGHVLLETVTLEDVGGGRTKVTDTAVCQTIEDRDGMMQSGMETGARESMDRLATLLAELA